MQNQSEKITLTVYRHNELYLLTVLCHPQNTLKEFYTAAYSAYQGERSLSRNYHDFNEFCKLVYFIYKKKPIYFSKISKTLIDAFGECFTGMKIHLIEENPYFAKIRLDRAQKNINIQNYSVFCSINNGFDFEGNRKNSSNISNVILNHIGSFFTNNQQETIQIMNAAKQRAFNLKFKVFLSNPVENQSQYIKNCKSFLLNGAEVIGPRKNVLFCKDNIGHCFEGELNWPLIVRGLIYLQVFIQKTKREAPTNRELAKAMKLKEIFLMDNPKFELYKKKLYSNHPFLQEIFILCKQGQEDLENENSLCMIL